MTALHETAYPRLKAQLSQDEIQAAFTPTSDEIQFMQRKTKITLQASQLGFMVLLKSYQCLGRPVMTHKMAIEIRQHIAQILQVEPSLNLSGYDRSTRKHHIKIVRNYLQINADKRARRQSMKKTALDAAATKENIADIINSVIAELIKSYFELPPFKVLLRLAMASRKVVNFGYYQRVASLLKDEQKMLINNILIAEQAAKQNKTLVWATIKKEAKSPTQNNIKEFIDTLSVLKTVRHQIALELDFIPPARLDQLYCEAMAADVADMNAMLPIKRYSLAVILIIMKTATAIDDLVSILTTWIKNLHTKGKENLDAYRKAHAATTDELIMLLYNMLSAYKNNKTVPEKMLAIENCLSTGVDDTLGQCAEHLSYADDNYFSLMLTPYKNKRHVIFQILENLTIRSASNDKFIEEALTIIKCYRHSHEQWLTLDKLKASHPEFSIDLKPFSDKWFKLITGTTSNLPVQKIHRHYYELAVLTELIRDLNCGDAYVDGAHVFVDPNKYYISWQQFYHDVEAYCELVQLPKDPEQFIAHYQAKLRKTAKQVDDDYHNNVYLKIENGLPVLKKLLRPEEPGELETLKQMIADKMPLTNIAEVIIDVEKWLNLSANFKPLSGYEPKIKDYSQRFVSTSIAYGCNLGPTQAERCLQKHTRKQIAWLFNHHVTEQKLNTAIKKVVNLFRLFDLPKHWGTGKSASVDGTFWDMYKQNLLATQHIRYGGYGGIGYYHVSDLYIALFSNFISCGVYEGAYLFDGIVENESEIQPHQIHGDTWAQNEVIFGLGPLFAIEVMPRIRNFKHLLYYKAFKEDEYNNINDLFTEQPIHWELIKTHYYDMLRIVMSIRAGTIKASTVLQKLNSKSRKNKLYFAFRELGRVGRTIFLLNYINNANQRRMIQAATCKSEEFNNFIGWVAFGDGGVIGDNMRYNQRKIIKFSHLVANMAILHNVVNMTRSINQLIDTGITINNEILMRLAPYWTEHINRFGILLLNMDKTVAELEYALNI